MPIKYWEFEDAPLKEKLKNPNIREIAKIFFDNDTAAYRFAFLILETKKKGQLRLRDVPKELPLATAKRYLDFAVQIGLLKHEDNAYLLTDRFSKPLKNIAAYMKEWMGRDTNEDLAIEFANARLERQAKRGGRRPKVSGNENGTDSAQSKQAGPESNAR